MVNRRICSALPSISCRLSSVVNSSGHSIPYLFWQRLLLPRIAQTSSARHALRSHHLTLLRRLTVSLATAKEFQAESLSVLPRPSPWKELRRYAQCNSVSDVVAIAGEKDSSFSTIPPLTLLRCGITDYGKGKEDQQAKPSTEDLFHYLESQIPWLVSEDGLQYEVCVHSACVFRTECVSSHVKSIAKIMGHTFNMPVIQQ